MMCYLFYHKCCSVASPEKAEIHQRWATPIGKSAGFQIENEALN